MNLKFAGNYWSHFLLQFLQTTTTYSFFFLLIRRRCFYYEKQKLKYVKYKTTWLEFLKQISKFNKNMWVKWVKCLGAVSLWRLKDSFIFFISKLYSCRVTFGRACALHLHCLTFGFHNHFRCRQLWCLLQSVSRPKRYEQSFRLSGKSGCNWEAAQAMKKRAKRVCPSVVLCVCVWICVVALNFLMI